MSVYIYVISYIYIYRWICLKIMVPLWGPQTQFFYLKNINLGPPILKHSYMSELSPGLRPRPRIELSGIELAYKHIEYSIGMVLYSIYNIV